MNTLVFVDLPNSDLEGASRFYTELFGWQINPRPAGEFHQVVPGEGLHLGLFLDAKQPPDPEPKAVAARSPNQPRVYIKVDDRPELYLDAAIALGATELWRDQWWDEFEGWHAAFRDPWGNDMVLWWKEEYGRSGAHGSPVTEPAHEG